MRVHLRAGREERHQEPIELDEVWVRRPAACHVLQGLVDRSAAQRGRYDEHATDRIRSGSGPRKILSETAGVATNDPRDLRLGATVHVFLAPAANLSAD